MDSSNSYGQTSPLDINRIEEVPAESVSALHTSSVLTHADTDEDHEENILFGRHMESIVSQPKHRLHLKIALNPLSTQTKSAKLENPQCGLKTHGVGVVGRKRWGRWGTLLLCDYETQNVARKLSFPNTQCGCITERNK